MTGAVVAGALALLLWPAGPAARRRRLATQAGPVLRPVAEWGPIPVPAAAGVAVGAVAGVLSTPLVAVLAGVCAFLGARAWGTRRRQGEAARQLLALTEGLAALAADLRSGRSLDAATRAAVAACGDVGCGRALGRALRSPDAGPEPGQDGAVSEALGRIASAVRLSERTGCSLAAVAGAVEDDLRARSRHRQELTAAVAAPRASATVLAGLPVLGLAMGSGVGADPWAVLTTTATGQVLLVAGVVLELAGLTWSGRLVQRASP
ncbi:pilus assembly protein TadB [Blastococcus sp. CT_GayMR20]|uniref:type II secretion system F family protein n=1 Tax=Blastococcus sp. CT_GayMR20 TaxID=2559609 RepID=UPI001074158B|nr:pilus assembly protein TadB [Blastococcus sp. CT_GayMR20]TFV65161.1 pilus assembly protein TadB [Blastococcus sp. CT_GayMR20]